MKILVIKTSSLGDIIHAFPAVQTLRQRYPDAEIDWVVEKPFAELVAAHPAVNKALTVNTKKWRSGFWKKEYRQEIAQFVRELRARTYDIVFDFQGNSKSGIITACAKSPIKIGFGFATAAEWPNLLFTNQRYNPPQEQNIREDALFLVQSALDFQERDDSGVTLHIAASENDRIQNVLSEYCPEGRKKVLVCPGSQWPNKQLSEPTFQAFLKKIQKDLSCHFLIAWGAPSEKLFAERLAQSLPEHCSVLEKMSLPTLQNLMSRMDLVIAMDSLPLHLAGTTPTPTYSVFGASSGKKYHPLGSRHGYFQGTCPYGKTFEKRCSILRTCQTGSCIKDIDPNVLFADFKDWWKRLLNE